LIEIDDTVSKERIHIMHKTGTYVEIDKDGQVVIKSVDNRFDVTTKDNNVYVGGNINLFVKGNINTQVNGSYTLNVDGPIVMNGSTVNINNGSMGAARIGDAVPDSEVDGTKGIGEGSKTVFIGD
jgi:hypothetical protein